MGQFIDYTGRRIGQITVITNLPERDEASGCVLWSCKCDCGKRFTTKSTALKHIKSCGCVGRNLLVSNNTTRVRKPPSENTAFSRLYSTYVSSAKRRGFSFNISNLEFLNLVSQDCYYCGLEPSQKVRFKSKYATQTQYYNGLDRVDNTLSYTIDNVVPCCKQCNKAKGVLTSTEFLDWVKRVFKHPKPL